MAISTPACHDLSIWSYRRRAHRVSFLGYKGNTFDVKCSDSDHVCRLRTSKIRKFESWQLRLVDSAQYQGLSQMLSVEGDRRYKSCSKNMDCIHPRRKGSLQGSEIELDSDWTSSNESRQKAWWPWEAHSSIWTSHIRLPVCRIHWILLRL